MAPTKPYGPKTALVLQGYFCSERFRGAGTAPIAQPKTLLRPAPRAPRPELLPAKMLGTVGQPQIERRSHSAWSGAPRPELLPGMGPTRVGGPRRIAQAQPSSGVSTTPLPLGQLRVIGAGRPLEPGIRRTMECFFQADFSQVRVHEGPAAQSMGALAFTLGEELHFAPGLYDPTTRAGVELLGHELTHVVQQRAGRVANPYGQGIAIVQDPALEAEADRMGQELANELWPTRHHGGQRRMTTLQRSPAASAASASASASAAAWTTPKDRKAKHTPTLTRDQAWADAKIVGAAQNAVNDWCEAMGKQERRSKSVGGDLVTCLWVYVGNDGAVRTIVASNENPGSKYKSKTPGKVTVCAEDVMYNEHPKLADRTLYSIAFNETKGMTWPACSTDHGGCRGLLGRLGIEEPIYAGLERDLKGKRIYDG